MMGLCQRGVVRITRSWSAQAFSALPSTESGPAYLQGFVAFKMCHTYCSCRESVWVEVDRGGSVTVCGVAVPNEQ